MLPDFDEHGYLPPGVHLATLEEIRSRFGSETEDRRAQFESIEWLVSLATRAGVQRIILNGSWTTASPFPNDVDCLLVIGADFPQDDAAEAELNAGLPFVSIVIGSESELPKLLAMFLSDRCKMPKGVVEIRP